MKKTFIIILLVFIVFTILRIEISNRLAIKADDYLLLVSEKEKFHRENMIFYEQLLDETSFATINRKARNEGFIDARILFLY